MKILSRAVVALSLLMITLVVAPMKPAQATTFVGVGDTVALADCLPCSFGGPLIENFATFPGFGDFDFFWVRMTGPEGLVNTFNFTPTTFMEVASSGDGINPVSPFLGNSGSSFTLQPGVTQSVDIQVGNTGALILNLFVPSGTVADASNLFVEPLFAFVLDPITGVATLGDPATACAAGSAFTFGTGCTPIHSGPMPLPGGGTAAPVPLPAAGLLLIASIGGLAALRRRKAAA